jgi:MFS superfamily sulfate permease-like transporter
MTRQTLMNDTIVGFAVGVMAIPQSMSCVAIVGVPYVIGMYTALVPTVVYAFLGTSRRLCVGPVAMESLLIASGLSGLLAPSECPKWYAKRVGKSQPQLCPEAYTNLVLATALVVGMLECAASLLGLGVLLRFMGKPVITGFTAGSAVVIMTSQLKDVPRFPCVATWAGRLGCQIAPPSGV